MKCSFCGTEIPSGKGKMYVKKDGKIFWFCSSKCDKNMLNLKRKPAKKGWTAEAKSVKKARMATLEHEKEKSKAENKAKK